MRCSQWRGFKSFELGHHIVWYIHGYECFGGSFCVCLHRPSDEVSSRSRPNHLCWPLRLHGPITEKTTIFNLNIIQFSCIVSLCYKNLLYTCQAKHSPVILHSTLVWAEMCGRKYNVKFWRFIYCFMVEERERERVCVCVCVCVRARARALRGSGYDMAGGCFTNYVLHSSRNYHQEHATDLRRLSKDVVAAWGAVVYVSTELPVCTGRYWWSMCSSYRNTCIWLRNFCENNVLFGNQGLSSHSEETKKVS